MGLFDFFRTPKPYCLEIKKKDGTVAYVSNIFIEKDASLIFDYLAKNKFVFLYQCVHGEAIATDAITGKTSRYYYYYELCPDKRNAMQFPHVTKMSYDEEMKTSIKIVFGSVEDAGGECKFVFHNQS